MTGINLTRLNAGALRRLDQEHRSARTLQPRSGAAELSLPVPAECTVKLRELLTVSEYAPTASGSGTTRCWSHRQPPMQRPRAVRGEGIKGKRVRLAPDYISPPRAKHIYSVVRHRLRQPFNHTTRWPALDALSGLPAPLSSTVT